MEIHPFGLKLQDMKSRTIQEKAGPSPAQTFLVLEVRRPPPTTHAQKRFVGGQRGVMSRDVLPRRHFGKIHLG